MLNFALIGAGRIGKMHAEIIQTNPNSKLKCVYDINQEFAKNVANLSNASVAAFKDNIVNEDIKSLSLIPGIGPKTAQRIILDIKEKIVVTGSANQDIDNSKLNFNIDDIYTALSSLGYKKSQIDKAIKKLNQDGNFEGNIEDVIKKILSIIR